MVEMIVRFFKIAAATLSLFAATLSAGEAVCPLDGAEDAVLQQQLQQVLENRRLDRPAERGEIAVSLLLMSDPDHPRLAQVNGHRMIYAASLPKIAILLGAAVDLDEGQLSLDPVLEQDIQNMMRYSCNDCATRVLDRVGRDHLLDILQSPQYGFYDIDHGGGLWVGKPYGPSPAYRRDPLAGLSHGATTYQVARLYCGLEQGKLVSPENTRLMRSALSDPGINHKFVKGLAGHDELTIFRKSGSWRDYHSDSMLVETEGNAYVLVVLTHSPDGSTWLESLAEPLHQVAMANAQQQPAPVDTVDSLTLAARPTAGTAH